MISRFWLKTDVRIGPGSCLETVDYIGKRKLRKIAVIIDHAVTTNPQAKKLLGKLKKLRVKVQIESVTITEADYGFLDEFRKKFSQETELLIGIGGGSVLDITKATSVLLVNPNKAIEYRGFGKITKEGPPIIAIPTTAGTGSEITPNASFIDKKAMKKMGINTDLYLPKLVLLDPLLTLTCPRSVTVGSGMDSIIHALEAYTAKVATPLSKIFSREALRILLRDLPLVVDDPENVELRQNLQVGALLAGVAMINSSGSLTAALSYPLGVYFKVPHGMAGAVYLAKVVRMNQNLGAKVYNELDDLLPKPGFFVDYLEKLTRKLEIPEKLTRFGVAKKDLPMLIDELMTFTDALEQNPVQYSKKELENFIYSMI